MDFYVNSSKLSFMSILIATLNIFTSEWPITGSPIILEWKCICPGALWPLNLSSETAISSAWWLVFPAEGETSRSSSRCSGSPPALTQDIYLNLNTKNGYLEPLLNISLRLTELQPSGVLFTSSLQPPVLHVRCPSLPYSRNSNLKEGTRVSILWLFIMALHRWSQWPSPNWQCEASKKNKSPFLPDQPHSHHPVVTQNPVRFQPDCYQHQSAINGVWIGFLM